MRCAGLLVIGAALGACAPEPVPTSAILITLDTTRADALGCYGRQGGVTPNLDRMAAEGVLFEAAHTVTPLTLPAHASMLTGLYPIRHSVRENGLWPLPTSAGTLAELASDAGYESVAFVAALVLDRTFGLDQGFAIYDVPPRPTQIAQTHYPERSAKAVVDATLAWLADRDSARPFFLWVHLFDPHAPLAAPAPFDSGRRPRTHMSL